MSRAPLVSVIIPTYNDSDVVCDAIDCSLNQTFDNIEVIVVDDGSTDGTERLLKEKYGNRIKYVYQNNQGLSSARNTGIRHASGKYYQFLDADDLIDQNKIRIQMRHLQDTSGNALAYCDYIHSYWDDNRIKYEGRMSPVLSSEKPFDDIMMKWETKLSIPHHCLLFDSAFFKNYGIAYDENLPNHEDWDLLMSVFAINPTVIFVDQPLAEYRLRGYSMSARPYEMEKGFLIAINKQIKKNRSQEDVVKKLKIRRKQIKSYYRYDNPSRRVIRTCRRLVKNIYIRVIPLWIQRRFGVKTLQ